MLKSSGGIWNAAASALSPTDVRVYCTAGKRAMVGQSRREPCRRREHAGVLAIYQYSSANLALQGIQRQRARLHRLVRPDREHAASTQPLRSSIRRASSERQVFMHAPMASDGETPRKNAMIHDCAESGRMHCCRAHHVPTSTYGTWASQSVGLTKAQLVVARLCSKKESPEFRFFNDRLDHTWLVASAVAVCSACQPASSVQLPRTLSGKFTIVTLTYDILTAPRLCLALSDEGLHSSSVQPQRAALN